MKEFVKLVAVLTIICVVSGSLLAYVNSITCERIWQAQNAEKLNAIKQVLGECDNEPGANRCIINENGKEWTFFVSRLNGEFAGAAFETLSTKGYGGDVSVMAGVDKDLKLNSIKVLSHKETPGLGGKIEGEDFRGGLAGRDIAGTKWKVKKDGGDIDQITAATISSRAVTEAVGAGIDVFLKHKAVITAFSEK